MLTREEATQLFISYDADGSGALTALPALCKGGKLRTLRAPPPVRRSRFRSCAC